MKFGKTDFSIKNSKLWTTEAPKQLRIKFCENPPVSFKINPELKHYKRLTYVKAKKLVLKEVDQKWLK